MILGLLIISFIKSEKCPNECSGFYFKFRHGICDPYQHICFCDTKHIGLDCKVEIEKKIDCPNNC